MLDSLSKYYNVERISLDTKKCDICKCIFKIWDINRNSGYVYNPKYYTVVTLDNFKYYDDFEPYLNKLDVEQIFLVTIDNYTHRLLLSKFTLPLG